MFADSIFVNANEIITNVYEGVIRNISRPLSYYRGIKVRNASGNYQKATTNVKCKKDICGTDRYDDYEYSFKFISPQH